MGLLLLLFDAVALVAVCDFVIAQKCFRGAFTARGCYCCGGGDKLLEVVKHSLPVATVEEAQVVNVTLLTLGAAVESSLITLQVIAGGVVARPLPGSLPLFSL
jgi:hypothetical protein